MPALSVYTMAHIGSKEYSTMSLSWQIPELKDNLNTATAAFLLHSSSLGRNQFSIYANFIGQKNSTKSLFFPYE